MRKYAVVPKTSKAVLGPREELMENEAEEAMEPEEAEAMEAEAMEAEAMEGEPMEAEGADSFFFSTAVFFLAFVVLLS